MSTQMAAAKRGELTPAMRQVLAAERIDENDLLAGLASGTIGALNAGALVNGDDAVHIKADDASWRTK